MKNLETGNLQPTSDFITIAFEVPDGTIQYFDIPKTLDLEEAASRWAQCGGQVRTFMGGEIGVDIDTLNFPDWLINQEGVRYSDFTDANNFTG